MMHRLSQWRPEFGMQDGGRMFEFTCLANDRRFAIALCCFWSNAKRFYTFIAKQCPKLFADLNQLIQILTEDARVGVFDDGDGKRSACRWRDRLPHFKVCFIDLYDQLANFCGHAGSRKLRD